jgi:hypothetical protein
MPGGFPFWHPRFWINEVAPFAIASMVLTAIDAARRHRTDLLRVTLATFPATWCAAAIAGRIRFPVTLAWLFLLPLGGAALMAAAWSLTFRRSAPARRLPVWGMIASAAALGAALPLAEHAPAPDTRPLDVPMPHVSVGSVTSAGRAGPRVLVHPGDGSLTFKARSLTLSMQPILGFLDRSPDGSLTILAPREYREERSLRLISIVQGAKALEAFFRAGYDAMLRVGPDDGSGPLPVEAMARLPRPVYSHLNSFCDIDVSGHKRLSVSFSPCPTRAIEVRPADYPTGRPLRVAYRDAADGFHVVEASSGEKGPFRELAHGLLARGEPLSITLHDAGVAVARVTLEDWSAQAGTILSPTAGWGLPVNAIEFSLSGDAPTSAAAIYTTLAGTSVGRGWDSVGHRAGTYRNRMKVEVLDDAPQATSQ